MKIGIVSDTHSNLFALESVLKHMENEDVKIKVHCGNLVGYGPKPSETLSLTLKHFNYIVKGNHDLACVDEEEGLGFNPLAKEAIDWTRKQMTNTEISVLDDLEYGHSLNNILFVNGSPHNPMSYLNSEESISLAFSNPMINFDISFVGNTHVPFVHEKVNGKIKSERPKFNRKFTKEDSVEIEVHGNMIVNVGSVGQPLDGDPRASYAIYDTDTNKVTLYKVPYSIEKTIGLMQREGFSEKSCNRLIFGR